MKYDTVQSTVEALTKNKKPNCVVALTNGFHSAIQRGFTNRQAYLYAELSHYLADHDGFNHLPELQEGLDTDEQVITTIENEKGEYTEEATLFLDWFKTIRSWDINVPIALAYTAALGASQEEYEETHDLDEADVIRKINTEIEDDATQGKLFVYFFENRNAGKTVRTSIREAQARLEQEQFESLLGSILGGGFGNPGLVN